MLLLLCLDRVLQLQWAQTSQPSEEAGEQGPSTSDEVTSTKRRKLRSADPLTGNKSLKRNADTLPALCIICKKTRKDKSDRRSGKRSREKLQFCETIHKMADFVPQTFGELSVCILRQIMKLCCFLNASRVDFVCDRYCVMSIKDAERRRRASHIGTEQNLQRALSSNQKIPQQYRQILMSSQNKECLSAFLVTHWQTLAGEELCGRTMFATQGGVCHRLSVDVDNTIQTEVVPDLGCDHLEADTRLLLHAQHASATHSSVVIKSPDTDVFLLCVVKANQVPCPLYFSTGCGNSTRLLLANSVPEEYGPCTSEAILGLHAFTGCDSTSALKGKGKIKPFELVLQSSVFVDTFAGLGQEWEVTPQQLKQLEEFVCRLYGQKTTSVNEARHRISRLTCKSDHALPPNGDCLALHSKRANYQAAIWRRCLSSTISAPPPIGQGWKADPSSNPPSLTIEWMTAPPAPACFVQLVRCACKKNKCDSNRCSCKRADMPCTDLCQCSGCVNTVIYDNSSDREESGWSSDDSDTGLD